MEISVEKIREIFSDEIDSIKSDRNLWTSNKKVGALHRLKSHHLMESKRPEFYMVNEIATQELDGLIIWSSQYLNECLNDIYIKLISGTLLRELNWLMEDLFDPIVGKELSDVIKEVQKKKKAVLKLKRQQRVQGTAITNYINNKGEGANGLLHERFEIIKKLNTEFGHHNRNTSTADYPFFKVIGSQFYDFEYVHRFMAIFERIYNLGNQKSNLIDDSGLMGSLNAENLYENHNLFVSTEIEEMIDRFLLSKGVINRERKVIKDKLLRPCCQAFYDQTHNNPNIFKYSHHALTPFIEWVNGRYNTNHDRLSSGFKHQETVTKFINEYYPDKK